MIKIRYSTIDNYSETRSFKTLAAARRYAQKWVGEAPEVGVWYAVSCDGVGKVTWEGCKLGELFPRLAIEEEQTPGYSISWDAVGEHYNVYCGTRILASYGTRSEALEHIDSCLQDEQDRAHDDDGFARQDGERPDRAAPGMLLPNEADWDDCPF